MNLFLELSLIFRMTRSDFPIFQHRPDIIYFDNGASAQKPACVLDAIKDFYENSYANIHRGPHFLAEEATILYNEARRTVADFIGARDSKEIIFTRNATEGINLVARSFGETLYKGDVVILSRLEHHANIVPWLQLKDRKGIEIRYFDLTKEGRIVFDSSLLDNRVKLVSVSGMSNLFGTITDLKPIIRSAHDAGALVLVDASQLAVHEPIDAGKLDAEFVVFTGHKLFGPTGIGVLYGKKEFLEKLPAFLGGGDMINEVYEDKFIPAKLPEKFEAGTPNVAGAIGLKAAIEYVLGIGFNKIKSIEKDLTDYLLEQLNALDFVRIIGPLQNKKRGPVVSFTIKGIHPHDVAEGLSQKNICIRAGQHCCQPAMDLMGLPATARASLAFYNTREEIDRFIEALKEINKYFN